MYVCIYINTHAFLSFFLSCACIYMYIFFNMCAHARACLMSTRTPFHLPLLLHPNLEFFIPQLPSAKCVLCCILCKFLYSMAT